ncbi:Transcription factor bhlh [Thalictrum thalictroides]|uniref:Transcription factor bhlh n=1 Tax=Thalictrum thalictroides TaxID=46969 RepID=A0A7J6XFX6_THATH|nr:Transcription factor bhlh [Thalictrum thalictroides]
MALETVVYQNDLFSSFVCKDLYSLGSGSGGGTGWNYDFALKEEEEQSGSYEHEFDDFLGKNVSYQDLLFNNQLVPPFNLVQNVSECHTNSSEGACACDETSILTEPPASNTTTTSSTNSRRKRRRTRINKNKEEVENQRMTHIVVERNRRKQMNEYLAVLRSLMPASYVQRSDQASIIGGAINFVKELEQFLQSLEAQKQIKEESSDATPFADFFAYPQYSSSCNQSSNSSSSSNVTKETMAENKSSLADIEVTMVESHANLKILSKKRPKQILKMVVGFQNLHLSVLHLNVTTVEQLVLYSFSVKVEEDCQLKSVDGIASAVHQMLQRIEEESAVATAAALS